MDELMGRELQHRRIPHQRRDVAEHDPRLGEVGDRADLRFETVHRHPLDAVAMLPEITGRSDGVPRPSAGPGRGMVFETGRTPRPRRYRARRIRSSPGERRVRFEAIADSLERHPVPSLGLLLPNRGSAGAMDRTLGAGGAPSRSGHRSRSAPGADIGPNDLSAPPPDASRSSTSAPTIVPTIVPTILRSPPPHSPMTLPLHEPVRLGLSSRLDEGAGAMRAPRTGEPPGPLSGETVTVM